MTDTTPQQEKTFTEKATESARNFSDRVNGVKDLPQQESWRTRFRSEFFIELESYIDSGYPQKVEAFISSERIRLLDEAEQIQKDNLEQLMCYLFRKVSGSPTMRLGKKRVDWLWGSMCQWCDEYTKKPYKDIKALDTLGEQE